MKMDNKGNVNVVKLIKEGIDNNSLDAKNCVHISQIKVVKPSTDGCEECLKTGDEWVFLRLCLTCGHVGCCDNSKNKHATKHYNESHHPMIVSYEENENWLWCYVDEVGIKP